MTDIFKKKIAEKAWQFNANEVRKKLKTKLAVFSSYIFKEQRETFLFGKKFWEKLDQIEYSDPNNITIVLNKLLHEKKDEEIYWLHTHANEAGILVVKLQEVVVNIADSEFSLKEDFLLADQDLQYGLCYEVGEGEAWLRFWGF